MIRGTTETFKFKLPFAKADAEWITIKFWQTGNPNPLLPIIKTEDHCVTVDGCECISLTAEETARFSDKYKAKMQIRAKRATNATVVGCRPRLITVYPMDDGIIKENPELPVESDNGLIFLDGGAIIESQEVKRYE